MVPCHLKHLSGLHVTLDGIIFSPPVLPALIELWAICGMPSDKKREKEMTGDGKKGAREN